MTERVRAGIAERRTADRFGHDVRVIVAPLDRRDGDALLIDVVLHEIPTLVNVAGARRRTYVDGERRGCP